MATTEDTTRRLAREVEIIGAERDRLGYDVGALEFNQNALSRIDARIKQSHALVAGCIGEPGEGWRLMCSDLQQNVLWAVVDLLSAAMGDLAVITAERAAERTATD